MLEQWDNVEKLQTNVLFEKKEKKKKDLFILYTLCVVFFKPEFISIASIVLSLFSLCRQTMFIDILHILPTKTWSKA